MEKNWLIRTHQNQILGPISKERVIELIRKGNLISEDEVCSGNGFWFQIKEKDLLEKHVYNNEKQTFNPVSEAKSIFMKDEAGEIKSIGIPDVGEPNSFPGKSDLEFPEIKKSDTEEMELNLLPESGDLVFPEESNKPGTQKLENSSGLAKPEELPRSMTEKKEKRKKVRKKKLKKKYQVIEEPKRNDRFLFYIFLLLLMILLGVFIFYKNTLNSLFPKSSGNLSLFFPEAMAQTIDVKKKTHLTS